MRLSCAPAQLACYDVGPGGLEPLPEGPDLQSGCHIQMTLGSHFARQHNCTLLVMYILLKYNPGLVQRVGIEPT